MYGFMLQDWVTLEGSTTATLIQEEADWLDLTEFQDITAWIDVRKSTNSPTLYLETAPSKDDVLFASMSTSGYSLASVGLQVAQLQLGLAAVPLAQFLRWRVSSLAGGWDVTFRVLIAANAPGLISAAAPPVTAPARTITLPVHLPYWTQRAQNVHWMGK